MVKPATTRARMARSAEVYLVTLAVHARAPLLHEFAAARRVIVELRRMHESALVTSLAWALLPDRLHWLLALGHGHVLPIVVQVLKARTAARLGCHGPARAPLRQAHYACRRLAANTDAVALARHIVAAPLRAGLATRIGDYPHWDALWL